MAETGFLYAEGMLEMKKVIASVEVIRHTAKLKSYSPPPGYACETELF